MSNTLPAITAEQVNTFFNKAFESRGMSIPETTLIELDRAVIQLKTHENMLRPGGFISGPVQMGLADHAAYIATFTRLGITPMALTSNLNIDFLRPCQGAYVTADAKMIKLGRSLAVINVDIRGSSSEKISSQAVVTYALPKE